MNNESIISFEHLEENNTIEVVKRIQCNTMLMCNPPRQSPDIVYKEIFGVVDGKIQSIQKVYGKHIPASFNQEQIIF